MSYRFAVMPLILPFRASRPARFRVVDAPVDVDETCRLANRPAAVAGQAEELVDLGVRPQADGDVHRAGTGEPGQVRGVEEVEALALAADLGVVGLATAGAGDPHR